ncbi:MAG: phosphatase PAP2 family protein [Bacteroidetes bacterium]|nr:MAG: phosphatase PAP2 family protein [Bacteroidota bacterium]
MKKVLSFALVIGITGVMLWFGSCRMDSDAYKTKANNAEYLHRGMRRITDIMRHDIFTPPQASRIYAYSSVAAYEALIPAYPEYKSLAGQLNEFTECPKPEADKEYCYPLASVAALMKVGKHLIFSEYNMEDLEEKIFQEFRDMNMPEEVYDRSLQFGSDIADHVIDWSKTDHYAETRSAPKYTIDLSDPARWVPTPPQYMDAVEPHWKIIRPWVLDSARQIKPVPHLPYSEDKNSPFWQALMEVYNVSKETGDFEKESALYWDCNPFEVSVTGHLMVASKKISPGGHWVNITGHACRKVDASIIQSAESYVMVSLALADAFIACWTEKYTSNLVRPETVINRSFDPDWHPYIETPPFPEHTSGHATISAAAATMLTKEFGEPFEFVDSTEMEFGMDPRTFKSFYEASDQAAMSRLWGGIHYRHANEGGRMNGREIGNYIWDKIKLK